MMGDLEEIGIESSAAVQDLGFDAALNVACQQEAALTKLKTESQRIIVSRSFAFVRSAVGIHEFKLSRMEEEMISGTQGADGYASTQGSLEQPDVLGCQRVFSHPKFTHLKIVEQGMKPGHVIVVRVRKRYGVQLPYAQGPEKGRDHLFTHIETVVVKVLSKRASQAVPRRPRAGSTGREN